jgi:hypothetical protein
MTYQRRAGRLARGQVAALPLPQPEAGIVAIDPGPVRSAWVTLNGDRVITALLEDNDALLERLRHWGDRARHDQLAAWTTLTASPVVVIEKVESFGMAVGREVFETVFWSGRFAEAAHPLTVERIGRKAVKIHLCGSMRAKDPNIRQALLDRYGGAAAKGTKAHPGPLYRIAGDLWSALAVGVSYADGAR